LRDKFNSKNFDSISIYVSEVTSTKFVEPLKELIAQKPGYTDIIAYSSNNEIFSNCSSLMFKLRKTSNLVSI
jgi:hypothetical protein